MHAQKNKTFRYDDGRRAMKKLRILILSFLIVSGLSCEYTFEPLQESDYVFSMNGYLDLYSGYHWIRVSPVRETVIAFEDSIDATVTLERESTGDISDLYGNKFTRFVDGKQVFYWNFISGDTLHGGEKYTVRATNSDGESSHATVEIPEGFPLPVSQNFDEARFSGLVTGSEVEEFVILERVYRVNTASGLRIVRITEIDENMVAIDQNDDFRIVLNDYGKVIEELGSAAVRVSVSDAYMIMASGNESWPERTNSDEEAAVLDANRNVINGLGVVAGIAVYSISLQPCYDTSNNVITCPPRRIKSSDIFKGFDQDSVPEQ